ncbi:hypothetical protein [Rhodovulum marinum]|uniref:PH (Pleckstrin Homology) domain-containing protein n=1 Tax=Rhodovulum marinum TaxID=320662 RepID=A0A4R2Q8Z3_9RHOB|nr:hypothetical protein [Rhodovulum marinum]TCP43195.1 hypothetical protein EV662_102391 [Rhodovulum marinum]
MTEELAVLRVSAVRRVVGLGVMVLLAGLLLSVALVRPPDAPLWRGFLLVLGGAVLALGEAMRRATAHPLRLTRAGLFDDTGRELARIDDIEGIERGMFALKPSNGFTLKLTRAGGRAWAPGVWWRFGRRLGVGGVTSAAQAKAMAEILTALLLERSQGGQGDEGA